MSLQMNAVLEAVEEADTDELSLEHLLQFLVLADPHWMLALPLVRLTRPTTTTGQQSYSRLWERAIQREESITRLGRGTIRHQQWVIRSSSASLIIDPSLTHHESHKTGHSTTAEYKIKHLSAPGSKSAQGGAEDM